jgi:imidazolonepropionase-like amidohydrolase
LSARATPAEALYRATLAPAEILGVDGQLGRLQEGYPMSFIEVATPEPVTADASADDAIRSLLPADLNAPAVAVRRVTLAGRVVFERGAADA